MSKITFENGITVDFEGDPTPQDIEEVAKSLNLSQEPTKPKKTGGEKLRKTLDDIFGGGKIGEAIGTAIARKRATPEERQFISPGPTGKQILGDVGRVGLNFFPIGRVSKGISAGLGASKLAKPISNIGTGALVGYGADITTKLAQGVEDPFKAGLGTGIGTGISTLPYIGKGISRLASESLGATTGTGAGTIRKFTSSIAKGGEVAKSARAGLRGKVLAEDLVEESKQALGQIIKNRSDDYVSRLSVLGGSKVKIDHTPIIQKFNKLLEDFKVFANPNGTPNFSRAPGLARYEKDLLQMSKTLAQWGTKQGDNTIVGMDILKQVLDDFRIGTQDSKKFDLFVNTLRSETKQIIQDQLKKRRNPKYLELYNKMLSDYETQTKEIREIQKSLSLGDKASVDTAFRKLSSVLRVNNDIRRKAIEELDDITGGTLLPKIAGQQLSEILPRGLMRPLVTGSVGVGALSGVGIIPMLKLALLSSPRAVGEILNVLGIGGQLANTVKGAIIKSGSNVVSPGDVLFGKNTETNIADFVKNPKIGLSIEDVSKKNIKPYKGETDLTTKILKDLEGKTTVSKQYILDATNRGELKQVERDLIRDMVQNEGDVVNVSDFAKKVKAELLPLERNSLFKPRYENIALPDEVRGDVANYTERVYESPIKTSAGDVHFSNTGSASKNYFGHTRIEDMADNKTRRVIEVQSDLYQKGNLEKEVPQYLNASDYLPADKLKEYNRIERRLTDLTFAENSADYKVEIKELQKAREALEASAKDFEQKVINSRKSEVSKLQPYRNTFHERLIREEIKKASQDGKTKLQFPTGETAMKIEGLGTQGDGGMMFAYNGSPIEQQQLKVGRTIYSEASDQDWVITETLGNGKFRAIPKELADQTNPEALASTGRAQGEMFDISGEIDTNNPIYKFYEKEVSKYLNKFGGKRVVDENGVSWIEVPIKKEWAKMPVEAFALLAGVGLTSQVDTK